MMIPASDTLGRDKIDVKPQNHGLTDNREDLLRIERWSVKRGELMMTYQRAVRTLLYNP